MDIQRINPSEKWSDVTVFNKIAYFVEVASDESDDLLGQANQVFSQAEESLASVNSDKSRILSATIYVTDFANLEVLNAAWANWLPKGCAPSRACLKVELVNPSYLVEIAFVAAVK
jgi:enamine deaminase RidA (YjgF/YER057c/UK114 family)